jgi:hypothetical protein
MATVAVPLLFRSVERRTLYAGLAVLALNLVDAFATLRHLDHGAEELNPLMMVLLRHGTTSFVTVKHALASVGVLGIAAHPRARAARIAMAVLVPLYVAIALYQVVLFWIIP